MYSFFAALYHVSNQDYTYTAHLASILNTHIMRKIKGIIMLKKNNKNRNLLLVSALIGTMLIFMFVTVIYVANQVANCSSVKKAKNICYKTEMKNRKYG